MRRRGRYGKSFNGLLFLLVIIFLSVFSGYMGTKYVIAPILYSERESQEELQSGVVDEGSVAAPSDLNSTQNGITDSNNDSKAGSQNDNKTGEDVVVGEQEVKDLPEKANTSTETGKTVPSQGNTNGLFCLQFGSFSNKEAASTCVQELTQKNISTFIMEKDGSFKVLSIPYETKEKANAAAEQLKPVVEDTYVVPM
ncbi:SPOR domain-containing protein [Anaerovorax sp. IOR16]|uniref:SPOR domain-containing protein n=1 Tax=Anaerovorax sp. IOR16 TaxID=2773458 RepID=UPI0019D24EEE|nr:SPOR domain-containing protein [Anaerovorax sp. IOR16]